MARAATKRLIPEPVPPALQAGDQVFVLLPVTIRQRVPGGFHVIGSGLARDVEPHQIYRSTDLRR